MTQWFNETVGDWTQQMKLDLEELDIPWNFEIIRSKSSTTFKELLNRKAKGYALRILTETQMKHSKMDNLHYSELRLQTYFKIPGIKNKEVLNLSKWRVGIAQLGEHFRGEWMQCYVTPMWRAFGQSTINIPVWRDKKKSKWQLTGA